MKTKTIHSLFVFAGAVLLAGALHAFEGTLDMRVSDSSLGAEPCAITLHAKGEFLRMEFTSAVDLRGRATGPVAVIVDRSQHKSATLMLDKETYTTSRFRSKITRRMAVDYSQVEFKSTGSVEKIAGIDAEKYTATAQDGKYLELWVTKTMGKFLLAYPGMGDIEHVGRSIEQTAWAKFAYAQDFFALRVIEYDQKGGAEKFRMEVTKVDQSRQQDSLFKIPSSFKKAKPAKTAWLATVPVSKEPRRPVAAGLL